jgi:hypothetical protein
VDIPVLVTKVAGNGYQAKGGEPFALTAEGATQEEAVAKLGDLIHERLGSGANRLTLWVRVSENPWLRMAGTLDPDDPMVQEWKQIMEENRRAADLDPDY